MLTEVDTQGGGGGGGGEMTAAAAWRGAFIERLKATGNVTLAAAGAGVTR